MIEILTLGPPVVRIDAREIGLSEWHSGVARDLTLFMARRPIGASLEELADAFWPRSTEARARSALHTALYRARQVLGADAFTTAIDRYALTQGRYFVDATKFSALIRSSRGASDSDRTAALESAVALVRGEYLEGMTCSWCEEERVRLNFEIADAMIELALLEAGQHDWMAAIHWHRQAIRHDPLREDAHRGLMRAHAALGNRALALRVFDELRRRLAAEIGVRPDPRTVALQQALLTVDNRK